MCAQRNKLCYYSCKGNHKYVSVYTAKIEKLL